MNVAEQNKEILDLARQLRSVAFNLEQHYRKLPKQVLPKKTKVFDEKYYKVVFDAMLTAFGVTKEEMMANKKRKPHLVVSARITYADILIKKGATLTGIGKQFNTDHCTIDYYLRHWTFERRYEQFPEHREQMDKLVNQFRPKEAIT